MINRNLSFRGSFRIQWLINNFKKCFIWIIQQRWYKLRNRNIECKEIEFLIIFSLNTFFHRIYFINLYQFQINSNSFYLRTLNLCFYCNWHYYLGGTYDYILSFVCAKMWILLHGFWLDQFNINANYYVCKFFIRSCNFLELKNDKIS